MALSRQFRHSVLERVKADPNFADAMLCEGVQAFLDDEIDVGKSMVRDYINATIGFEALARVVGKDPKSLMRMFSETGNPAAGNLFKVIDSLQKHNNVNLEVTKADCTVAD